MKGCLSCLFMEGFNMKKEDAENIARKSRNLQNPLKFFFGYIFRGIRQRTQRYDRGQEPPHHEFDKKTGDLLRRGGGDWSTAVSHVQGNHRQHGRNDPHDSGGDTRVFLRNLQQRRRNSG